jgi:hypothetical protein
LIGSDSDSFLQENTSVKSSGTNTYLFIGGRV